MRAPLCVFIYCATIERILANVSWSVTLVYAVGRPASVNLPCISFFSTGLSFWIAALISAFRAATSSEEVSLAGSVDFAFSICAMDLLAVTVIAIRKIISDNPQIGHDRKLRALTYAVIVGVIRRRFAFCQRMEKRSYTSVMGWSYCGAHYRNPNLYMLNCFRRYK